MTRFRRTLGAFLLGLVCTTTAAAQYGNFGNRAAFAGRDLLVSQPENMYAPGFLYVYRADAKGMWREAARIAASDSAMNDHFGHSFSVSGNTLVVSAAGDADSPGGAYVFERAQDSAPWRQTARVVSPDVKPGDRFGASVALSGDELFVGASNKDSIGVVYVFKRTAGQWTQDAVIKADSLSERAYFGGTVAVDGDLLAVSAIGADSGLGGAVVFRRDAAGGWKQEGRLKVSTEMGGQQWSGLGQVLMVRDGKVIMGAPSLRQYEGAVLIFERDTTYKRWTQRSRLMGFDWRGSVMFGSAVALVGKDIWVGAPYAGMGMGRVYHFSHDAKRGDWSGVSVIAGDSVGPHQGMGSTMAVSGTGTVMALSLNNLDFGEGRLAILTKNVTGGWRQQVVMGDVFSPKPVAGKKLECVNGKAGIFDCNNVELLSYMPVSQLGGPRAVRLSGIWGWTDPQTQKEYALVGRLDGAAFVDVSNPEHPRLVGELIRTAGSPTSTWREIKVYKNTAYIVSDAAGAHGMQVFDLTRLRGVTGKPVTFTEDYHYDKFGSAHNIVADTATGYLFATGANGGGESCGGGLHMIDARDPMKPVFAGCFVDTVGRAQRGGYTHDAQCVVYHGPDARYTGRQICVGSNADVLSIADVTDKANPVGLGRGTYPDVGYIHQGWFDDEHRYFYLDDETDEMSHKLAGTRTIIWDLAKLDEPVVAGEYIAKVRSTDHNLYVKGNLVFESNYKSGLRVLDISDRLAPREIGFLDCVPVGDNEPGYQGTWSNYPFFKSGTVVFSSMREGLFVVRVKPGAEKS